MRAHEWTGSGYTPRFAAASPKSRISSSDPLRLGLATLLIVVVATASALLPARRATKVDPVVALRYE